jgi:hypothetical protein
MIKITKYFFVGDPRSLINVLYLNNTMHFGMRRRTEHVKLRWGDVRMKETVFRVQRESNKDKKGNNK